MGGLFSLLIWAVVLVAILGGNLLGGLDLGGLLGGLV